MARNNTNEILVDLFKCVKEWVSEADFVDVCKDMVRVIEEHRFDVEDLYGHDECLDEALSDIFPDLFSDYDEEEY